MSESFRKDSRRTHGPYPRPVWCNIIKGDIFWSYNGSVDLNTFVRENLIILIRHLGENSVVVGWSPLLLDPRDIRPVSSTVVKCILTLGVTTVLKLSEKRGGPLTTLTVTEIH